tara:strand:- start:34567 stop:35421 length:855 start_codon:yes stop_codon:yes gene_type:complete
MDNKIIIGSAQFGTKYSLNNKKVLKSDECEKIFRKCKINKIKFLDTAFDYFEANKILKKLGCKDFNVITKIPKMNFKSTSYHENKIFNLLNDYNIKQFYAILLHDEKFIFTKDGEKMFNFLKYLKKNNVTKKIGVSVYNFSVLKNIVKNFDIDIVQCPINVFDREFIEKSNINDLKKKKIEIHARSIFLQGLLLLKSKQIPRKFKKYDRYFVEWENYLKKNKISNYLNCINFIKKQLQIDKVIVGVDNVNHLDEFIKNWKKKVFFNDDFNLEIKDKNLLKPYLW